ncbi:WD repeat-containing protein 76-like [Scleropages formosus]|uniref:WD repeat-containing protein 76 n=1 Tax=Scleropages formosus TaxID=113540 RepID=A0A0P7XUJ6_SCLFO|nr:WD repeat-containing protein 76-like [Scleropages formosus]
MKTACGGLSYYPTLNVAGLWDFSVSHGNTAPTAFHRNTMAEREAETVEYKFPESCIKTNIKEVTPPHDHGIPGAQRRSLRRASEKQLSATLKEGLPPKRLQYSSASTHHQRAVREKEAVFESKETSNTEYSSDSDKTEKEYPADVSGGLSIYELERLENIRQNQAFLSSINIAQATKALKQKPTKRVLKICQTKNPVPVRKSMRLQKKEAEVPVELPQEPVELTHLAGKPEGPIEMDPVNLEDGSKLPAGLLELWTECTVVSEKSRFDLKRVALKSMTLSGDRVTKVVKDRIFSAAFHPCTRHLLMAAGDKFGRVGLWDLGSVCGDSGVFLFEPHSRPVSCMAFSSTQPASLISLSYDGTIRSTNVEKAIFDEVYRSDESLNSFDFLSVDCSTMLVSTWDGDVLTVDRRTPGTSHVAVSTLDTRNLRCIHVHPVHKQYFVASESKDVHIYDVRSLKKKGSKPVSYLPGHSLSISCAYFSPETGNRVLTTCMDNKISHNVQTGRWLSKLRAVWDPKQEECFAVGSMARPRVMQVFHESGQLLHTFSDEENLSTVCSVVAFHPVRNALLGGNSSGRLHVFSD